MHDIGRLWPAKRDLDRQSVLPGGRRLIRLRGDGQCRRREVSFLYGFHAGLSWGVVGLDEKKRAGVDHVEMAQVEGVPRFAIVGHDVEVEIVSVLHLRFHQFGRAGPNPCPDAFSDQVDRVGAGVEEALAAGVAAGSTSLSVTVFVMPA